MHDVKGRIKLLIILIESGRVHNLSESKVKNWKMELNEMISKYEEHPRYKEFVSEIKNELERVN